jgi:hypothetical protein
MHARKNWGKWRKIFERVSRCRQLFWSEFDVAEIVRDAKFLLVQHTKTGTYAKVPHSKPNGRKIDQMAIK